MSLKRLSRHRQPILYGISLALLLFLLKWLELRLLIINHTLEIYVGAIAITFTALGIWLALKLMKPKPRTVYVEKEVIVNNIIEREVYINNASFTLNEKELVSLGLSKREMEVLELMSQGLSNQEISSRLYVSLNTVKTHTSKLFEKLDVRRRTQAVEKAKRLGLIP
jgi:two-component system, NarL family, response regulator LiaR